MSGGVKGRRKEGRREGGRRGGGKSKQYVLCNLYT